MKLSFYLFNENVKEFCEVTNQIKFEGEDAFKKLQPKRELLFECEAYFQKNRPTPPKWLNYIVDDFIIDTEEIQNQTNSFLLLVKVNNRIFAITAGYGFAALNRDNIERGFGLKVVLNEIDPTKIKSIDARKIDTTTKTKRIYLNRNSPLYDFDFDIEEEILNLVTGIPNDINLAKKIIGSDSLNITSDLPLSEIGEKCKQLLVSYNKDTYKQSFGFIDNLRIVKDPLIINQLDAKLLEAVLQGEDEKLMLAYPEIDSMNLIERFKIFSGRRIEHHCEELDTLSLQQYLKENNIQDIDLKKTYILGLNHENSAVTEKYHLYDYLVYETEFNESKYIFTLSKWFEIAKSFADEVDQIINGIDEIMDINFMPKIKRGQREDEYNENVAKLKNYLLLDKKLVKVTGTSKIEICDLYTQQRQFICVKKYNGSSTLSHLFNQGLVSARYLKEDMDYRVKVEHLIPPEWQHTLDIDDKNQPKIQFIFAISSQKDEKMSKILPFFSKVSLRYAQKEIERLGFDVRLYKVRVDNT